jgi:hypothetical protein
MVNPPSIAGVDIRAASLGGVFPLSPADCGTTCNPVKQVDGIPIAKSAKEGQYIQEFNVLYFCLTVEGQFSTHG